MSGHEKISGWKFHQDLFTPASVLLGGRVVSCWMQVQIAGLKTDRMDGMPIHRMEAFNRGSDNIRVKFVKMCSSNQTFKSLEVGPS